MTIISLCWGFLYLFLFSAGLESACIYSCGFIFIGKLPSWPKYTTNWLGPPLLVPVNFLISGESSTFLPNALPFSLNSRILLPQAVYSSSPFPSTSYSTIDPFLTLHLEKKNIPSYPCDVCSIVMNAAPRLFTTSARKMAPCFYAMCSLPTTSLLLNPSYSITAPVTYAATHWSNPMPTQTQAFHRVTAR